jgi:hypothetical protein
MTLSSEQIEALRIAREMAAAGIPIFIAAPNASKPGKYRYPDEWQNTVADPAVIDQWQPGWGLGAVGGVAADFLDMDPRSGGLESQTEMKNAGQWPLSFGQQSTPSGGTHDILSRTGERKETSFMPGLDFQAGGMEPDATGSYGRAFVWIAPTVGVSKETGELVPYRWVHAPDLEALDEWRLPDGTSSDASTEGLISRVYSARARKAKPRPSEDAPAFDSQLFTNGDGSFTLAEAFNFVRPLRERLMSAPIGKIEEYGMDFTLALEHFVPAFWSPEQAFDFVTEALSHTAYDPNGPSDWTSDKFLKRLDGRRPVLGSWKAHRKLSAEEAAAAFGHAEPVTAPPSGQAEAQSLIDALIGKMLTPAQMAALPPPEPLIKGLLDLDSLAWMIGLPGSFKSFIALDLAAHVGTGLPWRGMQVTQGPVVYIAAEGTRGMGKRIRAWEKKYGHMGDVRFLPLPIKIRDAVAWQTLIEACRIIRPVLVVIDTQARVAAGIEENSNTEMSAAIESFDAIKVATGACVLVVHHTTKSGDSTRGAGAQDGAQDTRIKLERKSPRSSMVVKFTEEKQKDLQEGADGITIRMIEEVISGPGEERLASLRVGSALEALAGTGDEPEIGDLTPWRGQEPADWTKRYVAYNSPWQRRILQVLFDHAETAGLSEAKVRDTVIARWAKPEVDTWNDAWPKVVSKVIDGEPLIASVGGRKYVSLHFREQIEKSGLS